MKRIAVDLAKSVYQVAESVRAGEVSQRKRLSRVAFARYVQEQVGPVEWVMEACGMAHYWGRVAQARGCAEFCVTGVGVTAAAAGLRS